MIKEEIRIKKVIVHILDSTVGLPVLSDKEIEFGSDFADFLREHIYKVASSDDCKPCRFYEKESEVFQMVSQYQEEFFVDLSKDLAGYLYEIMNSNIDIPPADLVIVRFSERADEYLGILKMNYKESYTHRTSTLEDGNANEIVKYKSILPGQSQRLTEAAIIRLDDLTVHAMEKKYEVNGEKVNYFTYLFLKCSSELSPKSKLSIVTRAIDSVQKDYYDESEQYEQSMRAKNIIHQALEEQGGFAVEEIAQQVFVEKPQLQIEFQDKMEKYDLVKQEVKPRSDTTMRKFQTQYLTTDSGIEIKIPMSEYNDPGKVEFITNPDGTVSVLIKNIGLLKAR